MIDFLTQIREVILSKTIKDTSIIFLGNIVSAVLAIILAILVARFLGPQSWGVVATAVSVMAVLTAVGDFGFSSALFRFVSRQKLVGFIFSLRLATILFLAATLSLFSWWISHLLFKIDNPLLTILVAVGVSASLMMDFQITSLESHQNWKLAAFFLALSNFLRLVFILILNQFAILNIINVLFIFVASPLLVFLLSLFWKKPQLNLGSWKNLTEVFRFTGFMGTNSVLSAINSRLPVLLLLQLAGSYQTGIFAAAKQLADGIPVVLGSFATVLAPNFVTYQGKNLKNYFTRVVIISLLLSLAILLLILASPLVIALFGEKYTSANEILQWSLLSLIPFTLSTSTVNILIYSFHKPQIVATLSTLQLPVVLGGNIYLIPQMGMLAPVLISGVWNTLTLFVTAGFTWYYFQKSKTL